MKKKRLTITISVILVVLISYCFYKKSTTSICSSAGINFEEFEKIQTGDSETKVLEIIDKDKLLNDSKIYNSCIIEISKDNSEHIYNYTYKYLGEKDGYVLITYTADYSKGDLFVLPTVSKKEQVNLK